MELKEFWLSEEKKSFQGWDFSYINDRTSEEPLPWDYNRIVRQYLKPDYMLLDMGTGGGEYLLSLGHPYKNTCVTEGYPPNVELCMKKLKPLGIEVRQVYDDGGDLPYDDCMFDMVINRHESFDANEVYRLLKPKGLFITQQVGGLNNKELSKFLIDDFKEIVSSNFDLHNNVELVQNAGFTVLKSEEYFPYLRFYDIGALVYLAKIIEWEFPNFSVERCYEKLCQLQSILEKQGFIESTEHRFIIVAQKPEK